MTPINQPSGSELPRSLKLGALAGFTSGLIMIVVMLITRFLLNTISLPELLSDWFVSLTPTTLFTALLGSLGASAKIIMFLLIIIGHVVCSTALGTCYTLVLEPVPFYKEPRWPRGVLFSIVLWILTTTLIVPLAGGGFLGNLMSTNQIGFLVGILIPYLIYGLFLTSTYEDLGTQAASPIYGLGRRYTIKWIGISVLVLSLGGYVAKLFAERGPSITAGGISQGIMPAEITPNEDFYIVSKNIIDPELSPFNWKLSIEGLVNRPYSLTYDELTALPWVDEFVTLECISNPVGGNLISNAKWRGVPLKTILERAELQPETIDIVSFAGDGYSESIPAELALQSQVMVAYRMNDDYLPIKHGFPARLVIPGLYGEKNTKWLTKIVAMGEDYLGFWQKLGWGDTAEVKTTSQIRVPKRNSKFPKQRITTGGIAFSGDKGISKVDISSDGGKSWMPAKLSDPLSPYTWVLWTADWLPTQIGNIPLIVLATDGNGIRQLSEVRGSFPSGATGIHETRVIIDPELNNK